MELTGNATLNRSGCGRIARVMKDDQGGMVNINKYKYISYRIHIVWIWAIRSIYDRYSHDFAVWHNYVNEICHRRLHRDVELETELNYIEVVLLNCLQLNCAWAVIDCLTVRRCW